MLLLYFCHHLLRNFRVLPLAEEDDGAILGSNISALLVCSRRIVNTEEMLDELTVGNNRGVIM